MDLNQVVSNLHLFRNVAAIKRSPFAFLSDLNSINVGDIISSYCQQEHRSQGLF